MSSTDSPTTSDTAPTKPSHSRPSLPVEFALQSVQAQRLYKRWYSKTDHKLYACTKLLRQFGKSRQALTIETACSELLDSFSSGLAKTLSELKAARKASPTQAAPISYGGTKSFTASVSTAFSSRLINLLGQLDMLVAEIETMELTNQMPPDQSASIVKSWSVRFAQLCSAIGNHYASVYGKPQKQEAVPNGPDTPNSPLSDP